MKFLRKITDIFADAIRVSDFAQDKALVKELTGARISRNDYDKYKDDGTVHEYFGHINKANNKGFFGLTINFKYEDAQRVRDYMLATDILSLLKDSDVIIDLDEPKNKDTREILLLGVQAYALKYDHPPNLMEPYCNHPQIKGLIQDLRGEDDHEDTSDGTVYNLRSATNEQLDEMNDNGMAY